MTDDQFMNDFPPHFFLIKRLGGELVIMQFPVYYFTPSLLK
ncbi:hypothetical protein predicted by Glimmer/Critica [Erwinia amylovora CFBP1430]|uniref:Uncharacterized protein n=2 Tax=Erwinia amylovora TaxID=552 RepID=D4HWG4_ERWAC|nr:hypothetical protein predicted by Glimmer/Critica [Erwinia amylovora CFBP1430]CBX79535.1 hypothetical protein predicted by Glimmer/Critica [Erwinia amylovora ATCC BAA-2158]